jgi:uncharacterized protein (DUF1499 family)
MTSDMIIDSITYQCRISSAIATRQEIIKNQEHTQIVKEANSYLRA